MSRQTSSEARRHFFDLLDAAERGESVTIERRGVEFRLIRQEALAAPHGPSPIASADADVIAGDWTWDPGTHGELDWRRR